MLSLIITVLNEGQALRDLLDSLIAQTLPADEIIVADGGSRDDTLTILRQYAAGVRLPLTIVEAPGSNISQGRNAALRVARGDLIAVTDGGVRCAPAWLERLTAPFVRPEVMAVAGFFQSAPQTIFETALGAVTLPEARDIHPPTYLPSSRSVAFRKVVWEAVGGYPEWLDYCEDVIFDLRVRALYGPFEFVPAAVVYFRPRQSLGSFARQYYRYARGDGKANLFPLQHALRYFAYLVVAPLVAYAALTVNGWLWLAGAAAGLAYMRLPLRRVWRRLKALDWSARLQVLGYIPVIRLVGDVAKMAGYPAGVWWRLGRRFTHSDGGWSPARAGAFTVTSTPRGVGHRNCPRGLDVEN